MWGRKTNSNRDRDPAKCQLQEFKANGKSRTRKTNVARGKIQFGENVSHAHTEKLSSLTRLSPFTPTLTHTTIRIRVLAPAASPLLLPPPPPLSRSHTLPMSIHQNVRPLQWHIFHHLLTLGPATTTATTVYHCATEKTTRKTTKMNMKR